MLGVGAWQGHGPPLPGSGGSWSSLSPLPRVLPGCEGCRALDDPLKAQGAAPAQLPPGGTLASRHKAALPLTQISPNQSHPPHPGVSADVPGFRVWGGPQP